MKKEINDGTDKIVELKNLLQEYKVKSSQLSYIDNYDMLCNGDIDEFIKIIYEIKNIFEEHLLSMSKVFDSTVLYCIELFINKVNKLELYTGTGSPPSIVSESLINKEAKSNLNMVNIQIDYIMSNFEDYLKDNDLGKDGSIIIEPYKKFDPNIHIDQLRFIDDIYMIYRHIKNIFKIERLNNIHEIILNETKFIDIIEEHDKTFESRSVSQIMELFKGCVNFDKLNVYLNDGYQNLLKNCYNYSTDIMKTYNEGIRFDNINTVIKLKVPGFSQNLKFLESEANKYKNLIVGYEFSINAKKDISKEIIKLFNDNIFTILSHFTYI